MSTRSLKVEIIGDFYRGKTYPRIRLQGQWLAQLGFPADSRVQVVPVADGELILKAERGTR